MRSSMQSSEPSSNSRQIIGRWAYMVQRMLSRSSAAHQPSSRRRMTCPPNSSSSIKRQGTPVSSSSRTSSRQQQAAQVEQLTLSSGNWRWGMVAWLMAAVYPSCRGRCGEDRLAGWRLPAPEVPAASRQLVSSSCLFFQPSPPGSTKLRSSAMMAHSEMPERLNSP